MRTHKKPGSLSGIGEEGHKHGELQFVKVETQDK